MTEPAGLPALSAIVVIPDTYATVARTMHHLKQQTAAAQVEIVLVVRERANMEIPLDELDMFHTVQICETPNPEYVPGLAAGIRAAHAPVIACTEDHAFPAPNWAERLIAAHENAYAVVGPAMRNANPTSFVSWADFYMGYGKWAEPLASGRFDFLMGHNGSYKRALLLDYGAPLEEKLASETVLQYELAARGHTFWLEAATYTAHLNYEHWRVFIRASFYQGRLFAGERVAHWTPFKRAVYTLAAPLVPFVRFVRIRRDVLRARFPLTFRWRVYAAIGMGLLADGAGQGLGFALGRGDTQERLNEYEFHRERHVKRARTATMK